MDETRKKYVLAGVLVGAVTVGLVVLSRRTPREEWVPTLRRIAGDALEVVKTRYGNTTPVALAEKTLETFDESGRETALSRAFAEAVEASKKK